MQKFRYLISGAILSIALTATPVSVATAAQPTDDSQNPQVKRSLVFSPGDYESKFYRIPGIVTAKDGSLVAVADKRIETMADLPNKIDVVARRSTDNGATWSDYITVAKHDSIGGYGDPAIVVDRRSGDILVISSHGNGLWQKSPAHISISRSKDNGKTWLPAVDINPQILTTAPNGKQPIKCVSAFASSGGALQLKNGRIMFALVTRQPDVKGFKVYAIYSDNGGRKWKVSKNPGTYDGDESKIVELADGTLIMSIRNRYRGLRNFSYSYDKGATWSDPVEIPDLRDPACNGDIIRYGLNGKNILLQSLPGSPDSRNDVSIYASLDNGKTWPIKRIISHCPSAYSAMTILPDGKIGILTEEENPEFPNAYQLWLSTVPIDYILSGTDK